ERRARGGGARAHGFRTHAARAARFARRRRFLRVGGGHQTREAEVNDRDLATQLLGVCKGILCDGIVSKDEVKGFAHWLQQHPAAAAGYPGAVLTARLTRILSDGRIDDEEREELHQLMRE